MAIRFNIITKRGYEIVTGYSRNPLEMFNHFKVSVFDGDKMIETKRAETQFEVKEIQKEFMGKYN